MRKALSLFIIGLHCLISVHATHNRAGEITYKHISGLTYEFTITTYTKTSAIDADRDELRIFWGDGYTNILPRVTEVELENNVKYNQYVGQHTYSGPFKYVVYVIDPNRVESILNMQTSVNVPFYLEDTLNILDPTVYGSNSSPLLLNPPIDFGNVNEIFVHNPNAFDPDGDSLSYRLISPKQGIGSNVPGYVSPDRISPGPDNIITLNEYTGELRWNVPKRQGIYNIAILITEYRNGVMIGSVVRDLQIIIQAAQNQPPVIEGVDEICVVAGDTILEKYIARDPNINDIVKFSSNGAPYLVSQSQAVFVETTAGNPSASEFYWATNCKHLRNTSYQVVVKAQDNAPIPLVDLKTVTINILAPAPENFSGLYDPIDDAVSLKWDASYACESSDKFQGYSIWRKKGCGYQVDTCNTDLASQGFIKIGETQGDSWVDTDLQKGSDYSYVVAAEFASVSQIGMLYNKFRGVSTAEVCIKLPLDLPLFYHVDVKETSSDEGVVYVDWIKPQAEALDTLLHPGPYVVKLYRVLNGVQELVKEVKVPTYSSVWDTVYIDSNLNTVDNSYEYFIDFFVSEDQLLGTTAQPSSVFLSVIESDSTLELNWDESVPWDNELYYIHLKQEDGSFLLLDSTKNQNYLHQSLSNDSTYCYKIESSGSYNREGLTAPLMNFSQIVCAQPKDTIPPCTPILTVENYCTNSNLSNEELVNYISWSFNRQCEDSTVAKYYIYYKERIDGEYDLIDSVLGGNNKRYQHEFLTSLSGCYKVAAIDEVGNMSELSKEVCAVNCPKYTLPNSFTPNGDGINDLYTPIRPYSGVSRINMNIYNRMGNLVFQTNSPDINWDGKDQKNGKELNTGVFYYVCEVYFQTAEGEVKLKEPLSGYIHLIREK